MSGWCDYPHESGAAFAMLAVKWPNDANVLEMATALNECARGIFAADKQHTSLFILLTQKDKAGDYVRGLGTLDAVKYMKDELTKRQLAGVLRRLVKKYDADLVLGVMEAWVYKGATAQEMEDWHKRNIRPSQRVEGLIITASTPSGAGCFIFNQIRRNGDEVTLDPPDVMQGTPEDAKYNTGRFINYWND